MEMILLNNKRVKVSNKEIKDFLTEVTVPIPNSYWRYSELLTENEVNRYLNGDSTKEDLIKIARYILIFEENLTFTSYLFTKAESGDINETKEFSRPTIKKLRDLYHKVSIIDQSLTDKVQDVNKMISLCMEIGADPL